jgi:hypothetical protein
MALCGANDSNPSMELTVTGISDGTNWLGCTWDNGETKETFVDGNGLYIKATGTLGGGTLFSQYEGWERQAGANGDRFIMTGFASAAAGYGHKNAVRWDASHRLAWGTGGFLPSYSVGVGPYNPNGAYPFGGPWTPQYTLPNFGLLDQMSGYIDPLQRAGSVTFANGATIAWSSGQGWA